MNLPMYRLAWVMAGLSLLAWQAAQAAGADPATPPATQTARVDTQPTTKPSPAVVALVAKLSDASSQVRDGAQADLIAMDAEARPSLQALLQTDLTPDIKTGIQAVLQKMDDSRLESSVITLHYTDAPVDAILKDFTKQAKADMGIHRKEIIDFVRGKKATIDVDHVSFWAALAAISQATGLGIPLFNQGNGSTMKLEMAGRFGPQLDVPTEGAVVCGPFVVVPQQCVLERVVNYARGAGEPSQFNLTMACFCEPKLHVVGQLKGDWIKHVLDENGHDLRGHGNGMPVYNMGRSWNWNLTEQLNFIPGMGKKIATLSGVIKADVQTQTTAFVVDDVLKSGKTTMKIGTMTVTFSGSGMQGNQCMLNFSINAPGRADAFNMVQGMIGDMELTDGNDQLVGMNQRSINGKTEGVDFTVAAFLQPNQKPKKLVWNFASETKPIEVPFEIHDLALPQ